MADIPPAILQWVLEAHLEGILGQVVPPMAGRGTISVWDVNARA